MKVMIDPMIYGGNKSESEYRCSLLQRILQINVDYNNGSKHLETKNFLYTL